MDRSGGRYRSVPKWHRLGTLLAQFGTLPNEVFHAGGGDKVSCATNGQHRPYACVHSCRHDALTSLTSQSRKFSCILCTWRTGFRVARPAAWRSARVRIPGRRFGDVTRRGREFGGVPRGSEVASRQQSGRSGSNCARSVPKWCRFGTLLYRIRFGTVRYTSNPTLV